VRRISLVSMVRQCKLVSGVWLRAKEMEISATAMGLIDFTLAFFTCCGFAVRFVVDLSYSMSYNRQEAQLSLG